MASGLDERTGSDQLTGLRAALDPLCGQPGSLLSGGHQLAQLKEGLALEAQLHTWLALQAARIDAAEIAWQEHGTSTASWLADAVNRASSCNESRNNSSCSAPDNNPVGWSHKASRAARTPVS